MKYPTKIIFELKKKKNVPARCIVGSLRKFFNSKVFVKFKQYDSRAGIDYKIIDIIEYGDDIEFKLIRADHKNE